MRLVKHRSVSTLPSGLQVENCGGKGGKPGKCKVGGGGFQNEVHAKRAAAMAKLDKSSGGKLATGAIKALSSSAHHVSVQPDFDQPSSHMITIIKTKNDPRATVEKLGAKVDKHGFFHHNGANGRIRKSDDGTHHELRIQHQSSVHPKVIMGTKRSR